MKIYQHYFEYYLELQQLNNKISVICEQIFYWYVRKTGNQHDDVIIWKHVPCYWHFVRGIHRSPVNSPHKGQWRVALMFSLIYAWTNTWGNNEDAGDLRRHRAHYDIIVINTHTPAIAEWANSSHKWNAAPRYSWSRLLHSTQCISKSNAFDCFVWSIWLCHLVLLTHV